MPKSTAIALVAGVLLTPWQATADNLFYDHSMAGVVIQNQITVHDAQDATYWCLVGNSLGYGGIQQSGNGTRNFIFSFWDQNQEKTSLRAYAPDLTVQRSGRFGDDVDLEGTGFQLLFEYAWEDEIEVRAAYRAWLEPDGNHLMLSGFYRQWPDAKWRYAGTFRARTNGGLLEGTYGFTESFGGIDGHRAATFSNHWLLTADDAWEEALSGSVLPQGSVLSASEGGVLAESGPGINATQADWSPLSWTTATGNVPVHIGYAVDCGRDSVVTLDDDAQGLAHLEDDIGGFEVDGYYASGSPGWSDDAIAGDGVGGAAPESVYRSWREGSGFSYRLFGLAPSTPYTLRLHFVETQTGATGERRMRITDQGVTLASDFDVYAAAGDHKPLVVDFAVQTDAFGVLDIGFEAENGSSFPAFVSGIEVLPADATPIGTDAGMGNDASMVDAGIRDGSIVTGNPDSGRDSGTPSMGAGRPTMDAGSESLSDAAAEVSKGAAGQGADDDRRSADTHGCGCRVPSGKRDLPVAAVIALLWTLRWMRRRHG